MKLPIFKKTIIEHPTPSRKLQIEKLSVEIPVEKIIANKQEYSHLCKIGCINFGQKYSCPPYSPTFEAFAVECHLLTVLYYRVFLDQYLDTSPYNRVRASNSVIKSLLDKELLTYKSNGYKVVGSGSCRACKACGAKKNMKCKKPEKIIYSLESLGVNVNQLVLDCFKIELQWYRKGFSQQFTSVVGGVLH